MIKLSDGWEFTLNWTSGFCLGEGDGEPVRLLVHEAGETECTGLIKAAIRCKRLGVSLGRLMMEMSR